MAHRSVGKGLEFYFGALRSHGELGVLQSKQLLSHQYIQSTRVVADTGDDRCDTGDDRRDAGVSCDDRRVTTWETTDDDAR
eukprot:266869-Prymnesium_polylepis.1